MIKPPLGPHSISSSSPSTAAATTAGGPGVENAQSPTNFIRYKIHEDFTQGKNNGKVATRFPPEPNGYLHIGHAKSICLNFGIARDYQGTCNLRFDDTNPEKEDVEYVDSIQEDVQWLGFKWSQLYYASDYFEKIYDYAVELIRKGQAFVCDLNADQIRASRGTLTEPGKDSPYRHRSVEENLSLFEKMRKGEFVDGSHVLRAKIDMGSPNMNLRDPVIFRIRKAHHHRTGDQWCIYPMYDFAHALSDMLEGITHSLCTLEFEDHRPLYDWFLDTLKTPCHPQQIEFSRLNLTYTVMSKRKLLDLVAEKKVAGWDDPRMPTIQGLRRRGFTPASIRDFCDRVGVTKKINCIEMGTLETCIREDLDRNAPRSMAVLRPLRVVIENYPEDQQEVFELPHHPQRPEMGVRKVPFSRVIWIEQDDFMENPPNKFFRLAVGREVRLRGTYFIKCVDFKKDPESGKILELKCTYDPASRGGASPDGRKVKGTIHWVSEKDCIPAEVRLYDRLFSVPFPGEAGGDFRSQLNPSSLEILTQVKVERGIESLEPEAKIQFERQGYFCIDRYDSKKGHLVLNRTVTLKDSWAKEKDIN